MSTWRRTIGIVLIVIGVLALVTPLTPGSWLIFIGAELLGFELVFARKLMARVNAAGSLLAPALLLALPFAAGALGAFYTIDAVQGWYLVAQKPWWTPPAYVFGPVWTLLYLLMGIASVLVWRANKPGKSFSLGLFIAHLAANALWSVLFFGLQAPAMALAVLMALWLMIAWLIVLFAGQSKIAAWLLVPYLLWVTYAMTLNAGFLFLAR